MNVAIVRCPKCKQKLGLSPSMTMVGTIVVCANPRCETHLRVIRQRPARVEPVPYEETLTADANPESYS
jgi:ssDNA-binding Zn-finger/Zn-ribbon topoisomerase 1